MKMSIKSNSAQMEARMDELMHKQIPFAMSLALNKSISKARDENLRHEYNKFFTPRNRAWFQQIHQIRSSKVGHVRKTGIAVAAIQRSSLPSPPGTTISRAKKPAYSDFMERFVKGGTKIPETSSNIAIPLTDNVRRRKSGAKAGAVINSMKPQTLLNSDKGFVFKSQKDGKKYIAQRYGRGGKNIRVLFSLRKSANIKGGYNPARAIKKGLQQFWPHSFRQAMVHAIKTAKLR
jgi:hypothetical protein